MNSHLTKSKGKPTIRTFLILILAAVILIGGALTIYQTRNEKKVTIKDIKAYEKIMGLEFSKDEREMMMERIQRNSSGYEDLRKIEIPNSTPPALLFNPIIPGMKIEKEEQKPFLYTKKETLKVPDNFEDLAFYSVTDLAQLIKTQQITSTQLTSLYLDRLKKYGPLLECVITLTEDLAMEQAKRADKEIAAGQ